VKDRYVNPILLGSPLRSLTGSRNRVMSRLSMFVQDGGRILDLGSGPGYFIPFLKGKGALLVTDPNRRALEKIKRQESNLMIFQSSASFLPLRDQSVDFVFSNLTLCCLMDHEGAISELMRVLRKGGRAYISVTRFKGRDPRGLSIEEWERILSNFKVLKRGESLIERWAVVEVEGT
jgi:ubiquinone/menaquinone biosynthesis C-methylase UbiE